MLIDLMKRGFCFASDGAAAAAPSGEGGASKDSGDAATGPNSGGGSTPSATGAGKSAGAGQNKPDEQQTVPAAWRAMPVERFNERLEQERGAGIRALMTTLGFQVGTPDALVQAQTDLKSLIDFAREQQRAQLSAEELVQADLQTAQQTAQTQTEAATRLQGELDTTQATLRSFVLRTEITQAAVAAGTTDADDVFHWALREQGDLVNQIIVADKPLFNDDGTFNPAAISAENAKKVVEECVKEKRHWFKPGMHVGIPSGATAQPPTVDPKADEKKKAAAALIKL